MSLTPERVACIKTKEVLVAVVLVGVVKGSGHSGLPSVLLCCLPAIVSKSYRSCVFGPQLKLVRFQENALGRRFSPHVQHATRNTRSRPDRSEGLKAKDCWRRKVVGFHLRFSTR